MMRFLNSCTFYIGVICTLVLIAQQNVEGFEQTFMLTSEALWRLDTWIIHMFMHSGWEHLICNMIGVLSIGYSIEKLMGKKKYLILYFLSGLAGSILQIAYFYFIVQPDYTYALVGASGALCGIIGALAYYRPNAKLLFFFIIPIKTIYLYWGFMALGFGFTIMNYIEGGGAVAHLAHNGGLIAGFILAKLLCEKIVLYIKGTNYKRESYEGYAYSVDAAIEFLIQHPFNFEWKHVEGRQMNEQESGRLGSMISGVCEIMKKSEEELKEFDPLYKRLKKGKEGTDNSPSE